MCLQIQFQNKFKLSIDRKKIIFEFCLEYQLEALKSNGPPIAQLEQDAKRFSKKGEIAYAVHKKQISKSKQFSR